MKKDGCAGLVIILLDEIGPLIQQLSFTKTVNM
jgi:hypothetical protein